MRTYKMLFLALFLIGFMGGCEDKTSGWMPPPDTTPPTVISTNPANNGGGLVNRTITATFSEAMDPNTLNGTTFTLMQGATPVSGIVTYCGKTATFTPERHFAVSTVYTATITTGATDLSGNKLAVNKVWRFTTVSDTTAAMVFCTNPADGATGVQINRKITATFSEAMDPETISGTTFIVKQWEAPISGTVSYFGSVVTFTPASNLEASTDYTVTITTGATDLAGNALAADKVWSFTTGATLDTDNPTVKFTSPDNGDTGVFLNRKIAATFSESMDPSTISGSTFTLMQGTTPVSGIVTYCSSVTTFKPEGLLAANTEYTATITTGVADLAGNAMSVDYVWSFNTGETVDTDPPTVSSTNPAADETDVPVNWKIAATFSEEMDPATITGITFTLTQGGTPVTGTVEYALLGNIATFTPDSNLAADTEYTATITTGATDLAGNALAVNYSWKFSTGAGSDVTPPTVTLTVPVRDAEDVFINTKIAATFSEAMDPSTLTDVTFTLKKGQTPVTGTVGYALVGNVATFYPESYLEASTVYTATITTGAADLAGNELEEAYSWDFTTGIDPDNAPPTVISTNPANLDINVAINKKITATFSKPMLASTITTANYKLTGPGTTPVFGTVQYTLAGNIATFYPSFNLAPSTIFTATITIGVKDLAGNAMEEQYVWTFTTGTQAAQTVAQWPVPLGSCSNFAILASAAISSIPTSNITGDVGLTPDTAANISGLTCSEVTGTIYVVDAGGPACAVIDPVLLTNAKTDAQIAFINARAAVRGTPQAISGDLNGLTLYPGLYESGSTIEISAAGLLYLDAQGDENAVFIIRSATSITTLAGSQVVLTKGAQARNVYWTAGSAVTLGTNSIMKGTIIAGTALSLLNLANLEGRALNQGPSAAAITCNACTITVPSPPPPIAEESVWNYMGALDFTPDIEFAQSPSVYVRDGLIYLAFEEAVGDLSFPLFRNITVIIGISI